MIVNTEDLRLLAHAIIDLAKEVGSLSSELKQAKLVHDSKYMRLVSEYSQVMPVNKSQVKARIETETEKEKYKELESQYDKCKLLHKSYEWFLITCRQENNSNTSHDIMLNTEAKDDLPF